MKHLDAFLSALESLPDYLVYLILGLSAYVENVFPPIPGDTITAFGAFLVGTKKLNLFGVLISTVIGSLLGFMSLFLFGRYLGRRFFIEKDYRFFKAKDIIRAEDWFRRYGYFLILFNRFFPGIRSVISLAGGISKLRVMKVTILAFISCCVWNLIWIYLGYSLGSNWDAVRGKMTEMMAKYNIALIAAIAIVIAFLILKKLIYRKKE